MTSHMARTICLCRFISKVPLKSLFRRLAFLLATLTSLPVNGQGLNFEEISEIQTKFEPLGGIINRGDGFFYGAARWSEESRGGVIYRLAPGLEAQVVHEFLEVEDSGQANTGGSNPSCGLVLGADGAMYGATSDGGAFANGVIYRITADGMFRVIHNMRYSEGYDVQSLVSTATGELYGAAASGGKYDQGTLFRISPEGDFESVHDFKKTILPPPWLPVEPGTRVEPGTPGNLTLGQDGKVYGTTQSGGPVESVGSFRFTYGNFFRYDGPGQVTILCDFDTLKSSTNSCAAGPDCFYATMKSQLVQIGMDGKFSVVTDFSTNEFGELGLLYLGKVLIRPEGVYGASMYGGNNDAGFIYRHTPGSGTEIIHHFSEKYRNRLRCLAAGTDSLIYGLAAFQEDQLNVAGSAETSIPKASRPLIASTDGPRTFRFRPSDSENSNFPPIARLDVVWLPAASQNGLRKVLVRPLINDEDVDADPLSLTSLSHTGAGIAEIVKTAAGPSIRFSTSEKDPASQLLAYEISDGRGGLSKAFVSVRSPAEGKYAGNAYKLSGTNEQSLPITLEIDANNVVNATVFMTNRKFRGRGKLGADDSTDFQLIHPGRISKLLHVEVKRGSPRSVEARIVGTYATYVAKCRQTKTK